MRGEAQPKRGAAREGAASTTLRSRSSGVAGGAKSAALRTTSPKVMAARDRDARATSRSVSPCVVRRSALAEARLFRVVANGVALRNSMHAADKVETKGSGPLRHAIVSAARVGERWLRVCNSGFYLPFELDGVRLFEPVQDVKPHDRIWTVPRTKGPLHAPKDHHASTTSAATTSASSGAHPTGRRVRRAGKSPLRHVSRDFSAPLLQTGSAAAAAHKDPSSATATPRLSGRPRLASRASASSTATSSSAAATAAAAAAKDEKYSAAAVCAAAAAAQQQQQLRLRSPPPAAVSSPSAAVTATSTATFRRTLSTVVSHEGDPRSPSPVRTPSRSRSPAAAAAAETRSSPASRSPAASSAHANVRRSLSGSASRGGSSSPQTPQTQLRRLSSPAASERRRGSPSVASTAATTTTTTAGRHSRGKSPSPTGSAVSSEGLTSDTNTQSSTSEVECIKSQLLRVVRGLESGCDKDQAVRALKDVLSGGSGGAAPAASSASSSFSSSSDNDALLSQLSALLDLESESTRRDRGLEARLRDEAQARRKIERELEDMKRRYEEDVAHGAGAGVGTSSSPCPKASTFIPLPHPHPCEDDVQQRKSVGVPPRASLRGGPQRMSVGHDSHDPSGSRMLRGRSFQGLESRSGSGRSTPRGSVGSAKGSPPSGGSVRVRSSTHFIHVRTHTHTLSSKSTGARRGAG